MQPKRERERFKRIEFVKKVTNVSEGTQERFGKERRVEWTWIMRELHYTDSKQAWEQLRQEGYALKWVASVGKDVSTGTVRTPLSMWLGKADASAAAGCLPFLLPDVTCSTRIVSLGQSRPLYPTLATQSVSDSVSWSRGQDLAFRIRSQSCSQSWHFSILLPIIFFIFQEEALESWVDLLYPQANNRKDLAHALPNSLGSQNAESSLCQRFLILGWINFHSWSSFRVDIFHTEVYLVLL